MKAGSSFIGPYALAVAASLEDSQEKIDDLLSQAESILDDGCVSHSYVWFTDVAINIALARRNLDQVERFAERLEKFTAKQPLAWPDFIISKARTLADIERNGTSAATQQALEELVRSAENAGLAGEVTALQKMLSG